MRLTRAAEYAIRCMVYLARQGCGILTSRQEIATQADIPPHFLAKIAQDLAKAGFIEIKQGSHGGFILRKDPAQISLLEIVETMIGEIFLNDCVAQPDSCKITCNCAVHQVWVKASEQLRETLGRVDFSQLIAKESCHPIFSGNKLAQVDPLDTAGHNNHDKRQ